MMRAVFLAAAWIGALASSPALAAQPASEAHAASFEEVKWEWSGAQGDRRPVLIKLVRGSVTVVRRPGPVTVVMRASSEGGYAKGLTYAVEKRAGAVTLTDRYPSWPRRSFTECRPPLDERGNFLDSDVRVAAMVLAPEGVPIQAQVMEKHGADVR